MEAFMKTTVHRTALATAAILAGINAIEGAPLKQAVWVYPSNTSSQNPVSTPSGRAELVRASAASGVTDLYVSVYQSTPNGAGRLMYADGDIADLIRQAHGRRIKVWAAYGNSDWPVLGCSASSFPLLRMAEVVSYNAAHEDAEFDGVALDIEPPEPQTTIDFQNLLALYQCIRESLPRRGPDRLAVAAAIRFFWNNPVQFPAGGPSKKVYEHIVDMELDHLIVMGYRNVAGTACSGAAPNGIICLDEPVIQYADQTHENNVVLVGLETSNCSPGCGPVEVTFFSDSRGQTALDEQAGIVAGHFRSNRSFGGFAIHRYQDSYLGGMLTNWPAVNTRLP
jgi:hypothetical protein